MIDEITIVSLSGRGSVTMRKNDYQGYWLGPVDWGQAQGQHQTYSYYNQVGESIVSTNILTRPISITGWVIDYRDTLQSRCDFLNAFISPVEDYRLQYKGYKIQFRPDHSVRYSREFKSNNARVRKFLIQGTAPYPLFTDMADTAVDFDAQTNLFIFPANFGQETPLVFGTLANAYQKHVYNSGGFATGMTISIVFSGDVDNPRIRNITDNNRYIGVNRSFVSGERLEICTIPGSKYIRLRTLDGSEENLIKYRDYQTTWIQLLPGANDLAIDCDELSQRNNMAVSIYYTPQYLEVE